MGEKKMRAEEMELHKRTFYDTLKGPRTMVVRGITELDAPPEGLFSFWQDQGGQYFLYFIGPFPDGFGVFKKLIPFDTWRQLFCQLNAKKSLLTLEAMAKGILGEN